MENKTKQKMSTMSMILVGMFAAIISVLAIFKIPMPSGVPATLQTFAIPLCGYVLGAKKGTASAALYVLLGLVGVPVYSGMTAGPGVLFGLTGGFLFGYIVFALLCGLGIQTGNKVLAVVLGLLGLVICHVMGTIQYAFLTDMEFVKALLLVSLPYIVKDIIFTVAAYGVAIVIRKALTKANLQMVLN